MTSDFENDEIKDSAFPVEFNDETVALDLYGVWVKNGPRDAALQERRTPSEIAPDLPGAQAVTGFDADISGLPDLPDFEEFGQTSATVEATEFPETVEASESGEPIETVETTDQVETWAETETEPFAEVAGESVSLDSGIISEPQEEDVSFDSFDISAVEPSSEPTIEELPEDFVTPEEFPEEPVSREVAEVAEVAEVPPAESVPVETAPGVIEDFDLSAFETTESLIADIPEETELPVSEAAPASPASDIAEDDFGSFLDDLNAGTIIDSSAVPAPKSGGSGGSASDDLDLDSFISSFNETGGASHDESEKLFDDVEPVDIDLEFDESFISDSEKIKATGASVSESEFFNSEFGVELIDETGGTESTEFDDMFKSVSDIEPSDSGSGAAPVAAADSSAQSDMETASEFDDLLASLDMAPAPAASAAKPAASVARTKGYDLTVTEEDGFTAAAPSVTESSADDEMDVSLFSTGTAAEKGSFAPTAQADEAAGTPSGQEPDSHRGSPEDSLSGIDLGSEPAIPADVADEDIAIDIPEIRDYNDTRSGLDTAVEAEPAAESFVPADFDDISAVEQELNEMLPETGDENMASNDKSTELLLKIADELSSIKQEISTLKSELAGYKAAGAVPEQGDAPAAANAENSGFFSDDDTDETIALTGDELNNILITADFTEEKNDEPSEEFSIPDELPESFGIDAGIEPAVSVEEPVSQSPAGEEPAMADDSAEFQVPTGLADSEAAPAEDSAIPESLPEDLFEMPDLDAGTPVEVSHVNDLNEDISYLEGSEAQEPDLDNVAIEEPELEIIDFDDEKLEEPELTEFNIDLTDIESGFPVEQDVSIPETAATDTETVGDVLAASGLSPDSFASESSFVVEPLPEIELPPEEPLHEAVADEGLKEEILSGVDTEQAVQDIPDAGSAEEPVVSSGVAALPLELKDEIKSVLSYMDQLLESLPEDKIEEFARSEHFEVYKKLFEELGIS